MVVKAIEPELLKKIIISASGIIKVALELFPEEATGCWLGVSDPGGNIQCTIFFGEMEAELSITCQEYLGEKAKRLAAHPEHYLSSQSADPKKQQYGGAIRGTKHIFVVSGFEDDATDEAIALQVAREVEQTTGGAVAMLVQMSKNGKWGPLWTAVFKKRTALVPISY